MQEKNKLIDENDDDLDKNEVHPARKVSYRDHNNPADTYEQFCTRATHKFEKLGLTQIKQKVMDLPDTLKVFELHDILIDKKFNLVLSERKNKYKPHLTLGQVVLMETVDINLNDRNNERNMKAVSITSVLVPKQLPINTENIQANLLAINAHFAASKVQMLKFYNERVLNEIKFTQTLYALGYKKNDIEHILEHGFIDSSALSN